MDLVRGGWESFDGNVVGIRRSGSGSWVCGKVVGGGEWWWRWTNRRPHEQQEGRPKCGCVHVTHPCSTDWMRFERRQTENDHGQEIQRKTLASISPKPCPCPCRLCPLEAWRTPSSIGSIKSPTPTAVTSRVHCSCCCVYLHFFTVLAPSPLTSHLSSPLSLLSLETYIGSWRCSYSPAITSKDSHQFSHWRLDPVEAAARSGKSLVCRKITDWLQRQKPSPEAFFFCPFTFGLPVLLSRPRPIKSWLKTSHPRLPTLLLGPAIETCAIPSVFLHRRCWSR